MHATQRPADDSAAKSHLWINIFGVVGFVVIAVCVAIFHPHASGSPPDLMKNPAMLAAGAFLLVSGVLAAGWFSLKGKPRPIESAAQPARTATPTKRLGGYLPSLLLLVAAALIAFAVPHWWPTAPRGLVVAALLVIWLSWRFAWFRKAAIAVAVVAILAVFVVGNPFPISTQQDPKNYPGYKKQVAGAADINHAVNGPDEKITINLASGSYRGPIRLDPRVSDFMVARSRNTGDWVSVWCSNKTEPNGIHIGNEDFGASEFRYCFDKAGITTEFYAQGRGTITIYDLKYKD